MKNLLLDDNAWYIPNVKNLSIKVGNLSSGGALFRASNDTDLYLVSLLFIFRCNAVYTNMTILYSQSNKRQKKKILFAVIVSAEVVRLQHLSKPIFISYHDGPNLRCFFFLTFCRSSFFRVVDQSHSKWSGKKIWYDSVDVCASNESTLILNSGNIRRFIYFSVQLC